MRRRVVKAIATGHRRDRQPRHPDMPHAVLALQAVAGNAAVRGLVRAGPRPTPFTASSGVIQPAATGVNLELGSTNWGAGSAPALQVRTRQRGDEFVATPRLGRPGAARIRARYPAAGLYPVGRTASGVIYGSISAAVSNKVRAGEQEHSDDAALAQRRVYGAVASAVGRAARAPATGPTASDAEQTSLAGVKDALPARLRWEGAASAAAPVWRSAVATVMAASVRRDNEGWHTMSRRTARHAEFGALGSKIPMGGALVIIEEGGEIGQHPPAELVDEAYQQRIEGT